MKRRCGVSPEPNGRYCAGCASKRPHWKYTKARKAGVLVPLDVALIPRRMLLLNILSHLSGPPVLNMGAHCQFLRTHFFKLCVCGGNQIDDRIKLGIR